MSLCACSLAEDLLICKHSKYRLTRNPRSNDMAATQTKDQTPYPGFESAAEQARETGDKFIEAGRKITNAYLDGVEKYVHGVASFQRKLGEQSKLEPFTGVLTAQAKLAEDLTSASVTAARELIAA